MMNSFCAAFFLLELSSDRDLGGVQLFIRAFGLSAPGGQPARTPEVQGIRG